MLAGLATFHRSQLDAALDVPGEERSLARSDVVRGAIHLHDQTVDDEVHVELVVWTRELAARRYDGNADPIPSCPEVISAG